MAAITAQTGTPRGSVLRAVQHAGLHHRKPYKQPTGVDVRQMLLGRSQGRTIGAIADALGFSRETVLKYTNTRSSEIPRLLEQLDERDQRNAQVRALQRQGVQRKEIAQRLGIAVNTVTAILKERQP
jgi:DNA-binding CsgD family transcriptional regulator